jgi:hypothetical protein
MRKQYKAVKKCPACGCKPDKYVYEPDKEQKDMGYPSEFRVCGCCMCPLLIEVDNK